MTILCGSLIFVAALGGACVGILAVVPWMVAARANDREEISRLRAEISLLRPRILKKERVAASVWGED